jgi:hypothetical protein
MLLFALVWYAKSARLWLADARYPLPVDDKTTVAYDDTEDPRDQPATDKLYVELALLFLAACGFGLFTSWIMCVGWHFADLAAVSDGTYGFVSAFGISLLAGLSFIFCGHVLLPFIVLSRLRTHFAHRKAPTRTLLFVYTVVVLSLIMMVVVVPFFVIWRLRARAFEEPILAQIAPTQQLFGQQLEDFLGFTDDDPKPALVLFAKIAMSGGWALLLSYLVHCAILGPACRATLVFLIDDFKSSAVVRDGHICIMGVQMALLVVLTMAVTSFTPVFSFLGLAAIVSEILMDKMYFTHLSVAQDIRQLQMPAEKHMTYLVCTCPLLALLPAWAAWYIIPSPAHFGPFNGLVFVAIALLLYVMIAPQFLTVNKRRQPAEPLLAPRQLDGSDAYGPKSQAQLLWSKDPTEIEELQMQIITKGPGLEHIGKGGADVVVHAKPKMAGEKVVPASEIVDHKNGKYTVKFRPLRPGDYTIHADVNGKPLHGTPVPVKIKATQLTGKDAYGPRCFATPVWQGTPVQGSELQAVLETLSKDGSAIGAGGANVEARVESKGSSLSAVPTKVVDEKNGKYTIKFVPSMPGSYQVVVAVNGKKLGEGPLNVHVVPVPVDAPSSAARGRGVTGPIGAPAEAKFMLLTNGKDGQATALSSEEDAKLTLSDTSGRNLDVHYSLKPTATRGQYEVQYSLPAQNGTCSLALTIDGLHIRGSPFIVDVNVEQPTPVVKPIATAKPSAQHSSIGVKEGTPCIADSKSAIVLTVCSSPGQVVPLGKGTNVDLEFHPPDAARMIGIQPGPSQGLFNIEFKPLRSGHLNTHVRIDDSPVQGSPLALTVQPSAAEKLFLLEPRLGLQAAADTGAGSKQGIRVLSVVKGTPAADAEIKREEFILAIEGKKITTEEDMKDEIHHFTAGDTINFSILGVNGRMRNAKVQVGARGSTKEEVKALRSTAGITEAIFNRHAWAAEHPGLERSELSFRKFRRPASKESSRESVSAASTPTRDRSPNLKARSTGLLGVAAKRKPVSTFGAMGRSSLLGK